MGFVLLPMQWRKNAFVSVEFGGVFRDFTDAKADNSFCIGRVEGCMSGFYRCNGEE